MSIEVYILARVVNKSFFKKGIRKNEEILFRIMDSDAAIWVIKEERTLCNSNRTLGCSRTEGSVGELIHRIIFSFLFMMQMFC